MASFTAPLILPRSVLGAGARPAPNDRLHVGFIGMGKQSRGLLGAFMGHDTQVVAVCDVDTTRRADAKKRVDDRQNGEKSGAGAAAGCAAYNDFRELIGRKDVDAVCIATPDHWHTPIMIAALKAGMDVYCEKPLTHNIHESIEVIRAVDARRRVLQTGSMQRSMQEFRVACELVRNGAIGKLQRVVCTFGDPGIPCDLGEEPMEPGLDWDMWIGPAPLRPYNSVLSPRGLHDHFPNWRRYREFGGGAVTDWGAHHLDIAQWGLGMDQSGPVEILPPADRNSKRGAKLIYANGVTVEHANGSGVEFYGTEGQVNVNRGQFTFIREGKTISRKTGRDRSVSLGGEVKKAAEGFLKDAKVKLYVSQNHVSDFLDCVVSRKKPITSEQVGARSAICCHLMNLAYYHGQPIKWDPTKLAFAGGTGDLKWLTRDYRGPWKV